MDPESRPRKSARVPPSQPDCARPSPAYSSHAPRGTGNYSMTRRRILTLPALALVARGAALRLGWRRAVVTPVPTRQAFRATFPRQIHQRPRPRQDCAPPVDLWRRRQGPTTSSNPWDAGAAFSGLRQRRLAGYRDADGPPPNRPPHPLVLRSSCTTTIATGTFPRRPPGALGVGTQCLGGRNPRSVTTTNDGFDDLFNHLLGTEYPVSQPGRRHVPGCH